MLHTVLRHRANGESIEDIRPDPILPADKRKDQSPGLASIYRHWPTTRSVRRSPRPSPEPTPTRRPDLSSSPPTLPQWQRTISPIISTIGGTGRTLAFTNGQHRVQAMRDAWVTHTVVAVEVIVKSAVEHADEQT
ncbi:hypothetical protein [Umezawaea sp. Da 62-37]|uniref:hypothetical protein n=1 Tax=Umezawaea sp. Da 62-37 TaxID=3075927 RepID=UPI0028F6D90D|nr:hypothetical protein [Umezawaea sp. Da 62-37]WNV82912.1 hypothetical protein RM788_32565 [Umezawaea sp. Da 62-37]